MTSKYMTVFPNFSWCVLLCIPRSPVPHITVCVCVNFCLCMCVLTYLCVSVCVCMCVCNCVNQMYYQQERVNGQHDEVQTQMSQLQNVGWRYSAHNQSTLEI